MLFTAGDGTTKLKHELESYSASLGSTAAWVQVPDLSVSSDTVVYLYYGNASAADQQNKSGVWDGNYKGVWHFAQNPSQTSPQLTDSTSNGNNGVAQSPYWTSSDLVTGKIGNAWKFEGNPNWIVNLNSNSSLHPPSGSVSFEFWILPNSLGTVQSIINNWDGTNGYIVSTGGNNAGALRFYLRPGVSSSWETANSYLSNGTWTSAAATYDSTSGNLKVYINGALQETQAVGAGVLGASSGSSSLNNNYRGFAGLGANLDEFRSPTPTSMQRIFVTLAQPRGLGQSFSAGDLNVLADPNITAARLNKVTTDFSGLATQINATTKAQSNVIGLFPFDTGSLSSVGNDPWAVLDNPAQALVILGNTPSRFPVARFRPPLPHGVYRRRSLAGWRERVRLICLRYNNPR
jgi:hypothetical protein